MKWDAHFSGNGLLRALPQSSVNELCHHFEPVLLPGRTVLTVPGAPLEYAFFPVSGMCSTIVSTDQSSHAISGLIGREGFVGAAIVLHASREPCRIVVEFPIRALRISASRLFAIAQHNDIGAVLLRYIHTLMVQTANTAVVNVICRVEERLARWLLMIQDRVDSNVLSVTHQHLARALAVRRAGVTEAIHRLEEKALVRSSRAKLQITNRIGLENLAAGTYGQAEQEYKRLIGSQQFHTCSD